jgi:hypothetical protein
LNVFAGGCDGLVGVGLRGERYEGDIGDLVDGLAADLGDLFPGGYGDEEEGSRDFEQACLDASAGVTRMTRLRAPNQLCRALRA